MAVFSNFSPGVCFIAAPGEWNQVPYAEIPLDAIIRAYDAHAGKLVQHGGSDGLAVLPCGALEFDGQHVALDLVSRRPKAVGKSLQRFGQTLFPVGRAFGERFDLHDVQSVPARIALIGSLFVQWDASVRRIQRHDTGALKPAFGPASLQPRLCLVARHAQMTHGPRPVQASQGFEHGGRSIPIHRTA